MSNLAFRLMIYTALVSLAIVLLSTVVSLHSERPYDQLLLENVADPTVIRQHYRDRLMITMASNAIKVFAVALAVFLLFQRLVNVHLDRIARYARELSAESLNQPLVLERRSRQQPDELDQVVQAINTMRENLIHTQQRFAEHQRQLAETNRMTSLGRMVSGVAHEINNPNNVVLFNAELLEEACGDMIALLDEGIPDANAVSLAGLPYSEMREALPTALRDLRKAAGRIQTIVDNLKKFYKAPTSTLERLDLNEVVENTIELLRPVIRRRTHYFEMNLDESLPQISGQPQELEQVLVNLVANALEALPDRGKRVWVETHCQKDKVVLSVRDEGCGISPAHREAILDPFFTTKQSSGGTGLGLSISYGLIRKHHGELEIDSELGEGTTVRVLLPWVAEHDGELSKVSLAHGD